MVAQCAPGAKMPSGTGRQAGNGDLQGHGYPILGGLFMKDLGQKGAAKVKLICAAALEYVLKATRV